MNRGVAALSIVATTALAACEDRSRPLVAATPACPPAAESSSDHLATRRTAWMQHFTVDAITRHKKPRKVLAFVDVFDRPAVMLAATAVGYESRDPVAVSKPSSEVMVADLPAEVLSQYKNQLGRVRERLDRLERGKAADKAFWQEREKVLEIVVDKRATCCVPQTALGGK